MLSLNYEQSNILKSAINGHNVFITGQGGSGKSFLAKEIFKKLTLAGKKVAIICSTGIACTAYGNIANSVSTVHSFYGLGTADLPWSSVVDRSLTNNLVCERVRALYDCIIWDEISMVSRRVFEIANMIHHKLSSDQCDAFKPMGGKQLILVGDFLQLPPVPNLFDPGKFVFYSPVFLKAVLHRIELQTIWRQENSETDFIRCLKDIRIGQCGEESSKFIHSLSRELPSSKTKTAINIFFRRLPMQVYNMNMLFSLPSKELFKFDAIDTIYRSSRYAGCMDYQADKVLLLKPGCRVMLLWNLTAILRNGVTGVFIGTEGDKLVVNFETVGRVSLSRETWEKRSRSGEIIASRRQFPVTLVYAITCHKSQSLTVSAAVVHCSKEFKPGLIYVALTRVKTSNDLQVLDFSPGQLLPPSQDCLDVSASHEIIPDSAADCCFRSKLTQNELTVDEEFDEVNQSQMEDEGDMQTSDISDAFVQEYFERGETPAPEETLDDDLDLETVCMMFLSEDCHLLSTPPVSFDIKVLLQSMKVPLSVAEISTGSAKSKNEAIDDLLQNNDQLKLLGSILWSQCYQIVMKESSSTAAETLEISTKQWYEHSRMLYLLVTRSVDYLRHLEMVFGSRPLTQVQSAIGVELTQMVYKTFVKTSAHYKQQELPQSVLVDVRNMPSECLAKVRHVGAWAIQKVLSNQKKYVRENMATAVLTTRRSVNERLEICSLIEENLVADFAKLKETTSYPETLQVTEDRQYRNHGLTHIEDSAYEFIIELEVLRVQNINDNKLATLKENLIDEAIKSLNSSRMLQNKWKSCFSVEAVNKKEDIIMKILEMVIGKYARMGAGQYMRDFSRAQKIKRTTEHRKRVLQKKKVLEEKKASIPFSEMKEDDSPGRTQTHHRLIDFVGKYGESAFMKAYNKKELLGLCRAYGVGSINSKTTKVNMVKKLIPVMKSSVHVPNPTVLDNV